jgi:peptide/nickel transport system substrate-binding protein
VNKKKLLFTICSLFVVTMLTISCQSQTPPTEEENQTTEETESTTPTTPTTPDIPNTPVTPPAKLNYGGTISYIATADPGSFDNIRFIATGEQTQSFYLEKLLQGNWATPRDKHSFMGAYVSESFGTGCLAKSWEIPDPLKVIIHLREGVYWQNKPPVNGREFVASDVVYTYGRMIGKGIAGFEKGSSYQTFPQFANVKNILAQSKYTVVFELSAPSPLLIENLGLVDHIKMIPREVVDKYGNLDDWRNAVGTGPFILQDYVSSSQVLFRKNPDYWGYDELHPENRLPYADYIRQFIINDASTSLAAFRTGKVDVRGVQWTEANSLRSSNPELIWKKNPVVSIVLAMRNDKPPFDNIKVRKALQMAMNLPEIAEEYYGGSTLGWFPPIIGPGLTDYWTSFEEYPKEVRDGFTYNVAGAKALLAEAGFTSGFETEIVTSPYMPNDLVELTQSYLAEIGVTMKIVNMDFNKWTTFVYGKQHQAMAVHMSGLQGNPLDALRFYYPAMTWNLANVNDSVFTKMVDDVTNESDLAKRNAKIKEAVFYGTSQFWVVRLPIYVEYVAWYPWLTNYQGENGLGVYNPGGVWARISMDQEMKNEMTGR